MSNNNVETVLDVRHWTDTLFSFRTTRDTSFRFLSGQFAMIGLEVEGKPLMRAYSMACAHYDPELEFFSIKVLNGPLTSRLQRIRPGDTILVGRKAVGTLVQDSLVPGRNLYLLGTGTGLAPFVSVIKDPEVYDRFEHVVLVHGCRFVAELAYGEEVVRSLMEDELMGELAQDKLLYYPTATREPFRNSGRITPLLGGGQMCADLGLPPLDAAADRAMLCGSPDFLTDTTNLLRERGFTEGSHSQAGEFVVEKAFVEK